VMFGAHYGLETLSLKDIFVLVALQNGFKVEMLSPNEPQLQEISGL